MTREKIAPVLGAGIHGAAIARELLLNGVAVCLLERRLMRLFALELSVESRCATWLA